MSSSVCQGLQSCLEPRFIEPRVLWLKPGPSKPTFTASGDAAPATASYQTKTTLATTAIISGNDYSAKKSRNADLGGWSFLQSLTTIKDSAVNEPVYIHPTVKRSASMLSEKSLEMCTESLGSETGSDVSENSYEIEIPLLSPETETGNPSKPSQNSKWMHRSNSFPPPLTSMSSSSSVQMRPHREGGRLVLQAVTLPSPHSYFHAERSEGRLRLYLVKDSPPISDNEEESLEEEEEEEAAAAAKEEEEEEEAYWGGDTGGIVEMVRMKSGWESFQGQAGARKVEVAIEAC
ncbi:hypothetical protein SLEP1_g36917 [Rubroshorea leprosula]|uniref:FAF domain-containing protein n=1 Tax=Rubroshorea leprosula TaxID=152421 RepID=A0AAV5KTH1_9ROSI|nr:hypothetical protein SLEP1_g36917 [Rubroshorea leprosula]